MKIIQTPNEIVALYEYHTIFRQIFTDGRALPPKMPIQLGWVTRLDTGMATPW